MFAIQMLTPRLPDSTLAHNRPAEQCFLIIFQTIQKLPCFKCSGGCTVPVLLSPSFPLQSVQNNCTKQGCGFHGLQTWFKFIYLYYTFMLSFCTLDTKCRFAVVFRRIIAQLKRILSCLQRKMKAQVCLNCGRYKI